MNFSGNSKALSLSLSVQSKDNVIDGLVLVLVEVTEGSRVLVTGDMLFQWPSRGKKLFLDGLFG